LHHFIARHLAGVRDRHLHRQRCVRPDRGWHAETAVGKVRVAQAKAEGELRLGRGVAIGAPGHGVFLKGRQLVERIGEGERQFAAWRYVAKEHVGDGAPALLPRIPDIEDRLGQVSHVAQGKRAASREYENQPGAVGFEHTQILNLHRRQPNLGAVTIDRRFDSVALLALHLRRQPHARNHDIRF